MHLSAITRHENCSFNCHCIVDTLTQMAVYPLCSGCFDNFSVIIFSFTVVVAGIAIEGKEQASVIHNMYLFALVGSCCG